MKPRRPENMRFPFFGHRTLAEVDETARLLAMKAARGGLSYRGDERLAKLLWKAERFNPPPAPSEPGAAA